MVDESVIPKDEADEADEADAKPDEEEQQEAEAVIDRQETSATSGDTLPINEVSVPENFVPYASPLEEKQETAQSPTIFPQVKVDVSGQRALDIAKKQASAKMGEDSSIHTSPAASPKPVYQIVNRKAAIRYYSQMQRSRTYPLSISFSGKPLISSSSYELGKVNPQGAEKNFAKSILDCRAAFSGVSGSARKNSHRRVLRRGQC